MKRFLLVVLVVLVGCKSSSEKTEVPDEPQTQPTVAEADAAPPPVADAGTSTDDAGPVEAGGEEVYERVCVTCHGKTGDGKGLGQQLFGFDTPANEWKNGPSVDGILITLEAGIHDTSMKAFPDYGDVERRAVAEYVLLLRAQLLQARESAE